MLCTAVVSNFFARLPQFSPSWRGLSQSTVKPLQFCINFVIMVSGFSHVWSPPSPYLAVSQPSTDMLVFLQNAMCFFWGDIYGHDMCWVSEVNVLSWFLSSLRWLLFFVKHWDWGVGGWKNQTSSLIELSCPRTSWATCSSTWQSPSWLLTPSDYFDVIYSAV